MAQVKLILLDDVEKLGLAGDEVTVSPGYARNFLLPRKLASKSTPAVVKILAARKEKIEAQRKDELLNAQTLATKITECELSIAMQAGEDDQLFGSVTARMIADKFSEAGIEVGHQRIKADHIKELGRFEIEIKLHKQVTATAKIWIVRG
ncbi:MAG: 50S ribosomal protein L9 [Victivallaceae bacterium]|nr:50S ribosomal protein L9 [Victivallaceae bacterium]